MGPYVGGAAARAARGRDRAHPGPVRRGLRAAHRGNVLIKHVDFDVEPEVAFDFLVDPRNRPLWQSSLRRVEDIARAEPGVGQTWTDVTTPGLRPAMETVEYERPRRWTERGRWWFVTAELTLTFTERPGGGCRVDAYAEVLRGSSRLRSVTGAAGLVVPRDLKRAARLLSERASEQ